MSETIDIKGIDHHLLGTYLTKKGWKKTKTNRLGIDAFIEPSENEQIEIFLPNNINLTSYDERIQEAIDIIAEYEDADKYQISRSIKSIDRDLHNYRVLTKSDALPVELMQELINSVKSTIKEAVRYEHSKYYNTLTAPEKEKENNPRDESNLFISTCGFAHTWRGSFGITFEVPLWLPSLGLFVEIPDTIGRKVTKKILKSFDVIDKAIERKSYEYIMDNVEDNNDILFLSEYTKLYEPLQFNSIDFNVELSPSIPIDNDFKATQPYKITQKTLRFIDYAINQINLREDELEIEIIGFPETISATMQSLLSDELNAERKVIVRGVSGSIKFISAKMDLTLEDYRKAIKAQDEARSVRVKCRVKKKIRGWEVLKVHKFELIS
jgi:hypothetical protein